MVIHSLSAGSAHSVMTSGPLGRSPAAMLMKAAAGSRKCPTPKRLMATSARPGSNRWVWASAQMKEMRWPPDGGRAQPGGVQHPSRNVDADPPAAGGEPGPGGKCGGGGAAADVQDGLPGLQAGVGEHPVAEGSEHAVHPVGTVEPFRVQGVVVVGVEPAVGGGGVGHGRIRSGAGWVADLCLAVR